MGNDFGKNGNRRIRPGTPEEREGTVRDAERVRWAAPRFPVFHVPHDGRLFPEELAASACVPGDVLLRYHEEMRDTDMTLAVPEACRGGQVCIAFPVSRLLCDVERFIGAGEVMERYGMGFCYERAYDGTVIKRVTEELRERTLRYYREHHGRMDRVCEQHPRILLIDLHSYSDRILPRGWPRGREPTPDLCVGTDGRFTPPELTRIVRARFAEAGFRTAVNAPYSGCFVPDSVMAGKSGCDCAAVMLEFHKRTYCDGEGESVPERLGVIRRTIRRVVADCAGRV